MMIAERAISVNRDSNNHVIFRPDSVTIRLMDQFDEKPEALDRCWDPQLELLGELLNQLESDDAMDLEELDGFFAALHCAPEMVMPSEYLPSIIGDHEFSDLQAAQLFLDLLTRHWNAVGAAFRADNVFVPFLLEDEDGMAFGNNWALGFLRGMDIRPDSWHVIMQDESQADLFVPIYALANELNPEPELRPFKEPLTIEQREKLLLGLSEAVTEIYDFLAPDRLSRIPAPIANIREPKIGRNDPCYCGSGKKYKKCCGGIKLN